MVGDIEKTLDKARSTCDDMGLKLTTKRCRVLQILLQAKEPLSAYHIIDHYRLSCSETLPAMSAYRMLRFLLQAGLIHKLETTHQYVACTHIACGHPHQAPHFLICDRCHQVKELRISRGLLDELEINIEKSGFSTTDSQLEWHGVCQACLIT